ncbi:MAG: invasion associated locus B family protein [Pseudomonadota bacterium]
MSQKIASLALAATTVLAVAFPAASQTATRKDSKTDWSIFVEEPPAVQQKTCWLASAPSKVENTRNGAPAEVNRGEIVLFVMYQPGEGITGEVSFASGYPFPENATVDLQIGSARYSLWTKEETAYSLDPEVDTQIHESMKRGAEAVVTGRSARGTDTKDTFLLNGFTAAIEEIEQLCGA